LKGWLKEDAENFTPPTLVDIIPDILSGGETAKIASFDASLWIMASI
jgi:hypothetical protein